MAAASRTAYRAFLRSTPATSSFRPAARGARFALPSQGLRTSSRRGFASEAPPPPPPQGKSSNGLLWAGVAAAAGAGGYFYLKGGKDPATAKDFTPSKKDYQKVYDEIAHKLAEDTDYDDGSYGPVRYKRRCVGDREHKKLILDAGDRLSSVWHGMLAVLMTRRPAREEATAPL